jgi:type II secretory pathway predicted ATPase ExeA
MPYRTAFNLLRAPFSHEIEPHALYESEAFQQCQARLDYARRSRGASAICGDFGSGKTTAVRAYVSRLALSSHCPLYAAVVNVPNPLRTVVESWLEQLGERVPWLNPGRALQALSQALGATYEKGRLPFLVIDEAHLLDERGLLQLKTLLNHGMDSRLPLALVLSGGPALARQLAQKKLEELRQRLLFVYPYAGLTRPELEHYIAARLKAAGTDRDLFPGAIIEDIHRHTQGIPRLVNQLATLALVAAATTDKQQVDTACLRHALAEMGLLVDENRNRPIGFGG